MDIGRVINTARSIATIKLGLWLSNKTDLFNSVVVFIDNIYIHCNYRQI